MFNIAKMMAAITRSEREKAGQAEPKAKVFDWGKAAFILADRKIENASCGLIEDWSWTGDTLIENGLPYRECGAQLYSHWATPVLMLHGGEYIECWMEVPLGQSDVPVWPESALNILFPPGLVAPDVKLLEKPKDAS